mmetsp:Transcript_14950/g.30387  ORF Transcript_14950/g.30387 Transcript_14950/m.30387 type:complete len:105 (+) Transcript_14950:675-989(+)
MRLFYPRFIKAGVKKPDMTQFNRMRSKLNFGPSTWTVGFHSELGKDSTHDNLPSLIHVCPFCHHFLTPSGSENRSSFQPSVRGFEERMNHEKNLGDNRALEMKS